MIKFIEFLRIIKYASLRQRKVAMENPLKSIIDEVLAEVEQLPNDWHGAGSCPPEVFRHIVKHTTDREITYSIETGTGKSTLLLSHISQNHKVFTLKDDPGGSLAAVLASPLLNRETVEFIEGPTQLTLPKYNFQDKLQFALLDGPHAYPFPELEYYYIYPHLQENALLVLDDIHIPTVYNQFNFLREDEMFELLEVVHTTAFFRRTDAPVFNPAMDGWERQNFNKKRFPVKIE